jgi:hypothetical protein
MKKSKLKEIIKESLIEGGYSKYYPGGKTPGLTSDVLNKILTKIAQGKEEKYEGDPERGNKILDTADQENIDRILRGDDEVGRMQELAGLGEIKVNNPILTFDNLQIGKLYNISGDYFEEKQLKFDGYNPQENNESAFFILYNDPEFNDRFNIDEEDEELKVEYWRDEIKSIKLYK